MISMMPSLKSTIGPHLPQSISKIWHKYNRSLFFETLLHLTCRDVGHSVVVLLTFWQLLFCLFYQFLFIASTSNCWNASKLSPWPLYLLHSLGHLIQAHDFKFHQYTEDFYVYISAWTFPQTLFVIFTWYLKFNMTKTEVLIYTLQHVPPTGFPNSFKSNSFFLFLQVKNIRVMLDSSLSHSTSSKSATTVSSMFRIDLGFDRFLYLCYHHSTLVQPTTNSHLNYCNSILRACPTLPSGYYLPSLRKVRAVTFLLRTIQRHLIFLE